MARWFVALIAAVLFTATPAQGLYWIYTVKPGNGYLHATVDRSNPAVFQFHVVIDEGAADRAERKPGVSLQLFYGPLGKLDIDEKGQLVAGPPDDPQELREISKVIVKSRRKADALECEFAVPRKLLENPHLALVVGYSEGGIAMALGDFALDPPRPVRLDQ
jgi:hypothetical protein